MHEHSRTTSAFRRSKSSMTDIDDLIARLERAGQSPMPSVFVVREAADALREQQAKIARLQKLEQQCWTSPEQWMAWCDIRMLERSEKAEAERDEWEHKAGQYMDERDAAYRAGIERAAMVCENATVAGAGSLHDVGKDFAAAIRDLLSETAGESPAPPQP